MSFIIKAKEGATITGKATNQVRMNIIVTNAPPALTILSPENTTYTTNTSILLNYSTTGNNVWYNLNNFSNTTLTKPIYFNTSEGSHILHLYANNSFGESTKNVVFFINLSAEETPVQPSPPPSGGDGGRMTGKSIKNFEIDKDKIQISLKQGETQSQKITIKNTESKTQTFTLSSNLKEFIKIDQKSFTLNPEKEKIITIDFIAREETPPNLYLGNIFINNQDQTKEILLTIEVESKKAFFDVEITIPEKYREISCGEEILFEVEIFNLGETKKVDTTIEYLIMDKKGNIIIEESETKAIETSLEVLKTIRLPTNIPSESYVVYVRAKYNGDIASSTKEFKLNNNCLILQNAKIIIYGLIILAIILLLTTLVLLRKVFKKTNKKKTFK